MNNIYIFKLRKTKEFLLWIDTLLVLVIVFDYLQLVSFDLGQHALVFVEDLVLNQQDVSYRFHRHYGEAFFSLINRFHLDVTTNEVVRENVLDPNRSTFLFLFSITKIIKRNSFVFTTTWLFISIISSPIFIALKPEPIKLIA